MEFVILRYVVDKVTYFLILRSLVSGWFFCFVYGGGIVVAAAAAAG